MAGLLASITQIPFVVTTLVLAGFALWGWRRSAATGALLIVGLALILRRLPARAR